MKRSTHGTGELTMAEMRLIDADRLNKPIYAEEDNITGSGMSYDEICGYNDGIDIAWNKIDQAPTIDAVPVVRCKDCIRRYDTDECPMCFLIEGKYYEYTNENGFCDRGERKEGAE